MFTRVELKDAAKQQIKGNIGMLLVITLIISFITGASSFLVVGPIILMGPLTLGLANIYLSMVREGKKPAIEDMFSGFNNFGQSLLLYVLVMIFTCLWSLLFVVPGIIKAISYSQSFYILSDHPEMTASEALKESMRIMDGHKMDYFVLSLSFILWSLLVMVTCGLAFIYVGPYMTTTFVNFYEKIKS